MWRARAATTSATALDDTIDFLKDPSKWDQNKAPGGLDDKTLARIQFASALAVAERHGRAASTDLQAAAKLLVADQKADGSWTLDSSQSLGSPATYGTIIATWSARSTLIASGKEPDDFSVVQADRWLRGLTVENVLDASSVILGLELSGDVMAENLRRNALSILRTGQAPSGGWGPFVTAAPQVFDTAMAVLALSTLDAEPRLARSTYRPEELKEAIAKGKALPGVATAPRRQLAGNDAARRPGKLRAAHLDDRLGDAGAIEVDPVLSPAVRGGGNIPSRSGQTSLAISAAMDVNRRR